MENRFLGVIMDSKLSWKAHISHTKKKIANRLSIINEVKHYLDRSSLHTLYCSGSSLRRGVEVWTNNYHNQSTFLTAKIIHKAGFLQHIHDLLIYFKLLQFPDIVI